MKWLKAGSALALLLLFQWLWLPQATATTNCTATQPTLSFGNVSTTGATDVQGSFSVTCNTFGLSLLAGARVRMCLSIGAGTSGGSSFSPRRMLNPSSDPLQFQIYTDPARTLIWGARGNAVVPNPLLADFDYSVPVLGGSQTHNFTLYGRIPAQTAAAGDYSNVFSGIHTVIEYRYAEQLLGTPSFPTSCTSGGTAGTGTSFPFTATATVPNQCRFEVVTDLSFGSVAGVIGSDQDQTSSIGLTCTSRTAWQLGLDNGQNAAGNVRRMRLGASGSYVSYELYRDSARAQRWGDTLNSDTVTGTGNGALQTETVYGRVPAQAAVPAGSYVDTITVTLTY